MNSFKEKHLEWMRVRHYSEATITLREVYLKYFFIWCEERGILKIEEITKAMLEKYQRWLYYYRSRNGKPLGLGGQEGRLIALKMFFKWLAKEHYIGSNPAAELELPRREFCLPRHVLTVSEVEQILHYADPKTPLGIRDRAILETFYSTGIRRSELAHLKIYDLDRERGVLMVRKGKGNKDRVVPIGDRALAWVEKYLEEARFFLMRSGDEGYLFLNRKGKAFGLSYLGQLIHEYIERANLESKKGSCHLFRHTMATLMLENGADIRFIQQMLGHSNLTSTQIYTQVSVKKLKEVHEATHPAKLKKTGDLEKFEQDN